MVQLCTGDRGKNALSVWTRVGKETAKRRWAGGQRTRLLSGADSIMEEFVDTGSIRRCWYYRQNPDSSRVELVWNLPCRNKGHSQTFCLLRIIVLTFLGNIKSCGSYEYVTVKRVSTTAVKAHETHKCFCLSTGLKLTEKQHLSSTISHTSKPPSHQLFPFENHGAKEHQHKNFTSYEPLPEFSGSRMTRVTWTNPTRCLSCTVILQDATQAMCYGGILKSRGVTTDFWVGNESSAGGQPIPKYPNNRKRRRIWAVLFSNLGGRPLLNFSLEGTRPLRLPPRFRRPC